jgi:GTP cyclohydrolase II
MDRQALHGTLNRHNLPYVTAKVERAGHWLGEMLEGSIPGK